MTKENLYRTLPKRHPRKLEDLNLIDNFLFQQMISQEETGKEFARLLLGTILGRPVRNVTIIPQKGVPGLDTDLHGIRMDAYIEAYSDESVQAQSALDASVSPDTIYDLEPNNTYEKKSLPRRMRYYHGLIDTQLLNTGTDYEHLPDVVIIVILPYDPFNKKRMVYTIENQCIEDSSVPYEDGARKIFLYTRGTEGNPSQELKDMLKYIEETTNANVTNQTIETIHNLVKQVKQNREVGINYMKSWEYEKMITDRATQEGLAIGLEQGIEQGRELGLEQGIEQGRELGLEQGRELGLEQGIEQGRELGLEQGFKVFIELCHDFNLTKEETLRKSTQKFGIPSTKAEEYLQKYW